MALKKLGRFARATKDKRNKKKNERDNDRNDMWKPGFDTPGDYIRIPVGNNGFYGTPPAELNDCDRWESSPVCGGNPFSKTPFDPGVSIVADKCSIGFKAEPTIAFMKLPPSEILYVREKCRPEYTPPSSSNGEETTPFPDYGYGDDDIVRYLVVLISSTSNYSYTETNYSTGEETGYYGYGFSRATTNSLKVLPDKDVIFKGTFFSEQKSYRLDGTLLNSRGFDRNVPNSQQSFPHYNYTDSLGTLYSKINYPYLGSANDWNHKFGVLRYKDFKKRFPHKKRILSTNKSGTLYYSYGGNRIPYAEFSDTKKDTWNYKIEFLEEVIQEPLPLQFIPPRKPQCSCKNMDCCAKIDKLERLVKSLVQGLGIQNLHQSSVTPLLYSKRDEKVEINNYLDIMRYQTEQLHNMMGLWEVKIKVDGKVVTFDNLAELLTEMMGVMIDVDSNTTATLKSTLLANSSNAAISQAVFKNYFLTDALVQYFGFPLSEKVEVLDLPISLDKGVKPKDFLSPSRKRVKIETYDEKLNFQNYLSKLLDMADNWTAQNMVQVKRDNPEATLRERLGKQNDLVEDILEEGIDDEVLKRMEQDLENQYKTISGMNVDSTIAKGIKIKKVLKRDNNLGD